MSEYDNYSKRTVGDFFDDVQKHGLEATLANRKMWGEMRMTPTDLSDVNGNTYTYLMDGTSSLGNWTGLFRSGERVRLERKSVAVGKSESLRVNIGGRRIPKKKK